MAHIISVSDNIYNRLKQLKERMDVSFSELIGEMLEEKEKKYSVKEYKKFMSTAKDRRLSEKVDEIVYGV